MNRLEIQLPGCTVRGRPVHGQPVEGFYVGKNGWKGWDDSTAGRRNAVPHPSAHGEFDQPVFRGARVVTIDGHAFARSEYDLGNLRALWTGVGADGDLVAIHARHQGEFLRAAGRVITATFNDAGYEGKLLRADVSLEMVCADPRKYGEAHTFTGASVDALNYGNFPASPVIEVVGPRTGPYTITGPDGRQIVVTQSLTAGQTHRLNFADGGLYRDGVRQLGAVSVFQPWTIPAGRSVPMGISSGQMTVHVTDTYM